MTDHNAHPGGRNITEPADLAISRIPDWIAGAACGQTDPEGFFPEDNKPALPAQRLCLTCPVRPECLAYALADPGLDGVWGGTTPRQRQRIRKAVAAA